MDIPYIQQRARRGPPKTVLFPPGIQLHGSLGPPESMSQMARRTASPICVRLTIVTKRHTDHATCVAIDRIYSNSAACGIECVGRSGVTPSPLFGKRTSQPQYYTVAIVNNT